jgi:hypothetical protein
VVSKGKPTVCKRRKAAVLGALWRVRRTPPGSESGAWVQRGNSGTWESHLSPCPIPGMGDRVTKGPGHEPVRDTTNPGSRQGSGKASAKRSLREGQRAVVASYSTDERGEVRPKRPTGGKATSGRACNGQTHESDAALTHRVTRPPWDCIQGQQKLCLRNRMREWRTYGSVGGPDGQPSALPGKRRPPAYASLRLPGAPEARR